MVKCLLRATEILSNDRLDLYDQLFTALQGNGLTREDMAKRFDKENQIISVYQQIINGQEIDSESSIENAYISNVHCDQRKKSNEIQRFPKSFKHIRSVNFALYSILLWFLGILTGLMLRRFLVALDSWYFELRIPNESIF